MPPFDMANYRWLALVAMGSFGAICLVAGLLTGVFAREAELGSLTARALLIGGAVSFGLGLLFFLSNYNGTVSS